MSRVTRNVPELLVPAGTEEALIAAVENGADAVYLGGRSFNARMNAANFDDDRMQKALDYAHKRGVRIFVTMNTLLRDDELDEAVSYATLLYRAGVDALIIQDLGLGAMIRTKMPDLPLHLSTQATVCDAASVRTAAKLGYERVVLARELTLEEIRAICREDAAEIEAFVHGALCICYSGQCQLSRYYGGRSGNRGACAQPCRLPYESIGVKGRSEGSHPLSPRDLSLIDHLGELAETGVRSLKIEGRMKSPEYVAVVTRIYRKYLDLYASNGAYSVSGEDRRALLQIFNRGQFTDAYLHGDRGDALMSGEIPKNQGILAGRVEKVKQGSPLIDIRPSEELMIGDGVEIRSRKDHRTLASRILTYRKELPGGLLRIGDLKGEVRPGDPVYRTSAAAQLEEARRTFSETGLDADAAVCSGETEHQRKCLRQRPVEWTLTASEGCLTVAVRPVPTAEDRHWVSRRVPEAVCTGGPYEPDPKQPTPISRYENAFRKTGGTPFETAEIRFEGEFDFRVRASELNALRRECLRQLAENCCFRRALPEEFGASQAERPAAKPEPQRDEIVYYTLADRRTYGVPDGSAAVLPLAEICLEAEEQGISLQQWFEKNGRDVIPYISGVSKGLEDEILERHLEELPEALAGRVIYAGSLGWLDRLSEAGIRVLADYGLNAYNARTADVLRSLGACEVQPGLESADRSQGAWPLMVSEHTFRAKGYRSDRGRVLQVVRRRYSSQTLLLPEGERCWHRRSGTFCCSPEALQCDALESQTQN
ncbi:MAG: U32 family peptidase [Mogibacterium sp.]|nr:U32 family peptidase [Mogibacterium sp.]